MTTAQTIPAQMRTILIAAGLGIAGATGINLTVPESRSQAFTLSMAKEMKADILRQVEQQAIVDHIRMMDAIPPDEVVLELRSIGKRLQAIENGMRMLDPAFRPGE